MNTINVGVADLATSSSPDVLKTILGSCIGIAIYSPKDRIGGLLHIMLPQLNNGDMNKAKYANTGIPMLISTIENRYGIKRHTLIAKIAGGANMFSFIKNTNTIFDIGNRNISAVKYLLKELGIPIVGEDVGANYGRRIEFYLESGKMIITGPDRKEVHA